MKQALALTALLILTACSNQPSASVEKPIVTTAEIEQAVDLGGQWLLTHESDEFIHYKFLPNNNRYSTDNNNLRKMGAMWILTSLADFSDDETYRRLATKGLQFFEEFIIHDPEGYAYFDIDDKRKLGFNAFYILALLGAPSYPKHDALLESVAGGILAQQQEDGSYKTYFHSDQNTGTDFYPGEANLALATLYEETNDERYLHAVEESFPYYRKYWRNNKSLAFVPWHAQAFFKVYKATGNTRYRDFVFEMNDWLVPYQTVSNDPEDESGGFTSVPGISTASYLEGLNDAYALAVMENDAERIQRYGDAIDRGNRFLLDLQYTEQQHFGLDEVTPKVMGGFRQSPSDSNLRVDNNQHAVIALIKALQNGF